MILDEKERINEIVEPEENAPVDYRKTVMRDKSIVNNFRPSVANNPEKTPLEWEVMRATMNVLKQSN